MVSAGEFTLGSCLEWSDCAQCWSLQSTTFWGCVWCWHLARNTNKEWTLRIWCCLPGRIQVCCRSTISDRGTSGQALVGELHRVASYRSCWCVCSKIWSDWLYQCWKGCHLDWTEMTGMPQIWYWVVWWYHSVSGNLLLVFIFSTGCFSFFRFWLQKKIT